MGLQERRLPLQPSSRPAIVTGVDSGLDVFAALGPGNGEAHVLRNAGGAITDDVIRSPALSRRNLRTGEVMLVHHDDRGPQTASDDGFRDELRQATGAAGAGAAPESSGAEAGPDTERD